MPCIQPRIFGTFRHRLAFNRRQANVLFQPWKLQLQMMSVGSPKNAFCHFLPWLAGAVLFAGCWQEIHYNPDVEGEKLPIVETAVRGEKSQAESESPNEAVEPFEPSVAEQNKSPAEVTVDELFGEASPEANAPPDSPEESPSSADSPQGSSAESANMLPATVDQQTNSEEPEADVTPTPEAINEPVSQSDNALAIWQMASRWSFAAAIYAKGQSEESYRDALDEASKAAEEIGVRLPDFPMAAPANLEEAVINDLLASNQLFLDADNQNSQDIALANLATRTTALLLVYSPKSSRLDPLIESIRTVAVESGLPDHLWANLVGMLQRRESFADVKQEVFDFHRRVAEHLGGRP